jgi:hypothetical protein
MKIVQLHKYSHWHIIIYQIIQRGGKIYSAYHQPLGYSRRHPDSPTRQPCLLVTVFASSHIIISYEKDACAVVVAAVRTGFSTSTSILMLISGTITLELARHCSSISTR